MKLLVTYASYHCATCQGVVRFEPDPEDHYGARQLRKDNSAVGACIDSRCEEFGKRFKVILPSIPVYPLEIRGLRVDQEPTQ